MCDVSPTGLVETQRLCEAAGLPQGLRVTMHIVDVADRTQVERFRDEVADRHQTDKIHLLFNNAGISGGGSMVTNSRDEWERTFNICWGGVYNCTRAFLPMLQNAEEGHIVNTSSINGFWASVGGSELADELAIGIELSKSYLGGGTITARDLDLTRPVTPDAPAKC